MSNSSVFETGPLQQDPKAEPSILDPYPFIPMMGEGTTPQVVRTSQPNQQPNEFNGVISLYLKVSDGCNILSNLTSGTRFTMLVNNTLKTYSLHTSSWCILAGQTIHFQRQK